MEKILELARQLQVIRGVPQFIFFENIYPKTMIAVRKAIKDFKSDAHEISEIDFIINSPGGSADDAYRIIRTLRKNFSSVNIVVPFWAKSAATLLSLGGSQIIMDEFGEFGPLDVQVRKELDDRPDAEPESALIDENSLNRIETRSRELYKRMFLDLYRSKSIHINKNDLSKHILDFLAQLYEPLMKQINPYKIGDKNRKLLIAEQYAIRILTLYNREVLDADKNQLIDYLVNGCPDHSYVIDYDFMAVFLPNVKKATDISIEYSDLLSKISMSLILSEEKPYVGFLPEYQKETSTVLLPSAPEVPQA